MKLSLSTVYFVILNKFRIEIYRRVCILIPFELGVINHRLNRACPLQREGRYKKQDPTLFDNYPPPHVSNDSRSIDLSLCTI